MPVSILPISRGRLAEPDGDLIDSKIEFSLPRASTRSPGDFWRRPSLMPSATGVPIGDALASVSRTAGADPR